MLQLSFLAPLFGKTIVVQWLEMSHFSPILFILFYFLFFIFLFFGPTFTNLWKRGCNPWATSSTSFPDECNSWATSLNKFPLDNKGLTISFGRSKFD